MVPSLPQLLIAAACAAVVVPTSAASAAAGSPLKLHMLGAGEGGNACLDGSPFGFYVQRNASSRDWVIDIEGGGWCTDPLSCVARIDTSNRLASSTTWAASAGCSGITCDDPEENPAYASYNHVLFPYCDGSSFTSHREAPLPAANGSVEVLLHMRGRDNLHAALAALKDEYGMASGVRNLVVTGGSAGGTSTFLHVDTLGRLAGAELTVGMPDAGAFRVLPSPACCDWETIVSTHNSTGSLDSRCLEAHPREGRRCFTATTLVPAFVQSPLFVLQSQFDHFQLSAMAQISCAQKQAYFPPWSTDPASTCSAAELAKISEYGAGWMKDFAALEAAPAVALFLTACVAHEERGTAGWSSLVAGGTVLRDAFAEFHSDVSDVLRAQLLEGGLRPLKRRHWMNAGANCTLPCNLNRRLCAPLAVNRTRSTS